MFVHVRLFAMLRERAGREAVEVELPEGATVQDALDAVARDHGLADTFARLPVVMAVNREYASADTALAESDELALIPPVSGGGGEADADANPRRAVSGGAFETAPGHESFMELKVSFLRPVGPGRLVAEGRVVQIGKTIAFLEGSLADDEGNVVATATATARIVQLDGSS